MRSLLPVVVLGTAVAAQASIEDLMNDLLPECVHSCAADVLETLTSCSLNDAECFCNSDLTTQNLLTSWLECPANANCDPSEIEAMKIGPEQINTQFSGVCDNPSGGGASGSGNDANDDSDDGTSGTENDSDDDGAEEETPNEDSANGLLPLSIAKTLLAAGAVAFAATF
ncbi:hypothetical protein BJX61DRAFT_355142 [Aspergillus egyptiacus]|nr:hypothetical protein BJX61DRAFT_355142 [Aspergillus egyptiacus]